MYCRQLHRCLLNAPRIYRQNTRLRGYASHSKTPEFSESHDAVVVGSGGAGLCAAAVMSQQGLKVLVLEKTKFFGGTTAFSGGGLWIPNNKYQKPLGIKDSPELADEYLHNVLGDLYSEPLVKTFIKTGPEMVEWLDKNTAVKLVGTTMPDYKVHTKGTGFGRTLLTAGFDGRVIGKRIKEIRYTIQGYHAFGSMQANPADLSMLTNPFRSFKNFKFILSMIMRYALDLLRYGKGTKMENGNALIGGLFYTCQQLGVDMRNNTAAVRATSDGKGKINGLIVRGKDGNEVAIKTKNIILASGGFGRSEEAKKYVYHDWCVQPAGNVGDGKKIGIESGGVVPPPREDNAIYAPVSVLRPKKGPARRFPHFSIDRTKPGSIIVDFSGRRFANESEPYQDFVKTMHDKRIPTAFMIGDRRFLKKYGMGVALPWPYPNWRVLRRGYLLKAPSITSLAEKIGIPPENLKETVERCNKFAEAGVDQEFDRGGNVYDALYGDPSVHPNPCLGKCIEAPFYALPLYPGNVSTVIGLSTDENARVLRPDGTVIDGLFAVGCDMDSVMRGKYPGGGSSIGPGMTFAYRAGLTIAGRPPAL